MEISTGYLLKNGRTKLTQPQKVAATFNSYFIDKAEELLETDKFSKEEQRSHVYAEK
jgi:hypothetical protein